MIKKFSLPDYYGKGNYILDIIKYRKYHLKWFYEDRIIDNAYGAHPSILWTGGRITTLINAPEVKMQSILDGFNQFPEVKLRHVCTNKLITEELTLDYKSNYFIQHYVRKGDEIIIANPILIAYFKEKYPNIPLIYSTTMGITDIEKINQITENNLYVMNYNYNNDNEYIHQLTHLENIEILCAEPCDFNCPKRMQHYDAISKQILGINTPFVCVNNSENRMFDEIMALPHAITNERIEELSRMGIQYFKISGRTYALPNWLYCILYYLVKPEYLNHVFLDLLSRWW